MTATFRDRLDKNVDGDIVYIDKVSLYPSVQMWSPMPVGEPEVLYDVDPKDLDFNNLFIMMARVEPPKSELMPCLPYRTKNGKCLRYIP